MVLQETKQHTYMLIASVGWKSRLLSRNIFVKRRKADKPNFSSCLQLPGNIKTCRKYHKFFVLFSFSSMIACQHYYWCVRKIPYFADIYNTVDMSLGSGIIWLSTSIWTRGGIFILTEHLEYHSSVNIHK